MTKSDYIHPMRYMRTRPFARRAMQLYGRVSGRRVPSAEVLQSVADLMMGDYDRVLDTLPREERPARPTQMLTEEASLACHVGAFTAYGRNVFLLSRNLTDMLGQTDLHGVRARDIRMPFPAFHVSFGDAFKGSLPGPPNQIDGAYLSELDAGRFQVLVTSRRLDARPDRADGWPFSRDLYYFAPLDTTESDRTFDKLIARAVEEKEIPVEPDLIEPDDDVVLNFGMGRVTVSDVRHETQAEHADYMREGLTAFGRALSLAVNSVCYLNAVEDQEKIEPGYPDDAPADLVEATATERRSTRKAATANLLDRGFMPVYLTGHSVRLSDVQGEESGREVSTHWRRGHWRRQPVGPRRSQRRLTWVRPALVRADKGEATAGHVYRVRTDKG